MRSTIAPNTSRKRCWNIGRRAIRLRSTRNTSPKRNYGTIKRLVEQERDFAENSAFPAPETAGEGVYCEGCHVISPDWRRPRNELLPPKSAARALYRANDFGQVKASKKRSAEK